MSEHGKTDWVAIEADFVGGTDDYATLCKKYGVNLATMRQRAHRHGWPGKRHAISQNVIAEAVTAKVKGRVEQLRDWNSTDIMLAGAIRAKIARRIAAYDAASLLPSVEVLRTLASAAESVQRMARLAMGATTENTGLSNADGTPINPPTLGDFYKTVTFVGNETPNDGSQPH
jgi:hypothetical protein